MTTQWITDVRTMLDWLEAHTDVPTPQHSLDRIDNNGHYEVGNIRWATQTEQANNKRNNRRVTIGNETRTIAEWARIQGLPYYVAHRNLVAGACRQSADEALTTC